MPPDFNKFQIKIQFDTLKYLGIRPMELIFPFFKEETKSEKVE